METPSINYLTVELLILFYVIFLMVNNFLPLLMIVIFYIHLQRLKEYYTQVNKDFKSNFKILMMYLLLIFGLIYFKNFIVFGILFGLLQYFTYLLHEKQQNLKFKWFDFVIDIPMIIFSFILSYIGLLTNNLYLSPFLGDFIYHILEILR